MTSDQTRATETVYGCIVGESAVKLWGLSSRERLRRLLERAGVDDFVPENTDSFPAGSIVFARADYLFDERAIKSLVDGGSIILRCDSSTDGRAIAARVPASLAPQARDRLRGEAPTEDLKTVREKTPDDLTCTYRTELRKVESVRIVPIEAERRAELERFIFDGSYKGVTDFVTKWVWPAPARWATRMCMQLGIQPNHVTILSLTLVIVGTYLFAIGEYAFGLALGWSMTFLDTVDGKLARVTITSSRFGQLLDHGLDTIHPPFWYLAWGYGLATFRTPFPSLTLNAALLAIVIGYIAGRLFEGAFTRALGKFSVFCWRPVDSYFRLVTARRNPNLVLLTAGAVAGRPDAGLLGVAVWTVASSLFLLIRLLMAIYTRLTSGPLQSWLEELPLAAREVSRTARPFVGRAMQYRVSQSPPRQEIAVSDPRCKEGGS